MEDTMVRSMTVESVSKYTERHPNVAAWRNCLVVKYSDLEQSKVSNDRLYDEPMRVDALMFLLCVEGEMTLACNLKELRITTGCYVVIPPKSIVQMSYYSADATGYIMLVSQEYMSECNINVKKVTAMLIDPLAQLKVIGLNRSEGERMYALFELIFNTFRDERISDFREDIVRSQLEMIVYVSCELLANHLRSEHGKTATSTRSEVYFRRFIKELSEHYLERQSVAFYADRLCISPRYLTTIVRRVSGSSVTDWLNRYMMMEAKYLLKYSEMSIQEIAYKLNFPNQSFFGKYFKQHAGIAPSLYRRQS